jgi:hypothetical protein
MNNRHKRRVQQTLVALAAVLCPTLCGMRRYRRNPRHGAFGCAKYRQSHLRARFSNGQLTSARANLG